MLQRLRHDFHLSIITLLGACAVFGISPFAVYRYVVGDLVAGLIDTAIVLFITAAVTYAWYSGNTARAGLVLSVFNTVGGFFAGSVLGDSGVFWLYVTFLSNFLLTQAGIAAVVNVIAIAATSLHGSAFSSVPQMASFVVTSACVSLFAFIFAYRAEVHRRQFEKLATHDPLTGAGNRRTLNQELRIAVATARRTNIGHGLIMLDLDRFKQVNDEYGHDAGDRVLVDLTALIEETIRDSDRLFRFGGEEFVLLLPGVDLAGLQKAAENLRCTIAAQLRSPGGPVTASLGIALLCPGETWETWLQRADAALYRAKNAGRNRTIVDGLEPAAATSCGIS